jgi:tyrosine-specific transport protein
MNKKNSLFLTLTVSTLITGSLIGAGILALPIKTGLSGFFPSIAGMVIVCFAMLFTALILAREATDSKEESFHYATLYQNYLGPFGKWAAIAANMIVLYGLLTAYMTGAATVLSKFFHLEVTSNWVLLAFFALMTGLLLTGIHVVRKYNALLMVIMWGSFAIIVYLSSQFVEPTRFNHTDWEFLPTSIPIIVTAFYFHNIIPSCCHALNWNYKTIAITLILGILIGLLMYVVWLYVSIGTLPLEGTEFSLMTAFQENLPATIPLSEKIGTPMFATTSIIFAILAISTSYIACGTGLMAFIRDLTENHLKLKNRYLVVFFSFAPPLAIALIYPNIFLKTLDVVGGVGIVILFGILPCIIAIKKAKTLCGRIFCILIFLTFTGFLGLEIAQELGFMKIQPHIEIWKYILHR